MILFRIKNNAGDLKRQDHEYKFKDSWIIQNGSHL